MSVPNDITLFWYSFSPYARKISWYLTLRGLSHAQVMQPGVMPRPDLDALNISYRRIPVLSIGRDMYLDTRLMLRKLDELFPHSPLAATTPEHAALAELFSRWTGDGGVFARAAQLIPLELPNMRDPAFVRDRENLTGRPWKPEALRRARPEALVHVREAFEVLERSVLRDGREWVFGGPGPSIGDIEAIWPLHWLRSMGPGALDAAYISATQFPLVFAWMKRFNDALKAAAKRTSVRTLSGAEFRTYLAGAKLAESAGSGEVDASDPTGLRAGDEVTVGPTDTGTGRRDRGTLVSLTPGEAVIEKTTVEGVVIRVHVPRWGYRILKANGEKL